MSSFFFYCTIECWRCNCRLSAAHPLVLSVRIQAGQGFPSIGDVIQRIYPSFCELTATRVVHWWLLSQIIFAEHKLFQFWCTFSFLTEIRVDSWWGSVENLVFRLYVCVSVWMKRFYQRYFLFSAFDPLAEISMWFWWSLKIFMLCRHRCGRHYLLIIFFSFQSRAEHHSIIAVVVVVQHHLFAFPLVNF